VAPRRALVIALVAGSLALVAAGCGANTAPYTAAGTAPCLKKKGFTAVTTDPSKLGFIAAFSTHGGLFARAPGGGNNVTIAFAGDAAGAASTEKEFRQHAPPKLRPHLADVMSSQRNAVLVWTVSPSAQLLSDAVACLSS
jgi:hypothetical protein